MSTLPSRPQQTGPPKKRRGDWAGGPESGQPPPGSPMPPDAPLPLGVAPPLPMAHGLPRPPPDTFPVLSPQVGGALPPGMPPQGGPYPGMVYPGQPPPYGGPEAAFGSPGDLAQQPPGVGAAVTHMRGGDGGMGMGSGAAPGPGPGVKAPGAYPRIQPVPNGIIAAPGVDYDGMSSGIPPAPPPVSKEVAPGGLNGLVNSQIVHLPPAPARPGVISPNLQRLFTMAGIPLSALDFLTHSTNYTASANLQQNLENQLKQAILHGTPLPHVKLMIEDQLRLEEKKQKKRAANRRSASSSRARKKKYIEKLTNENRRLQRISRILAILPDLVMVVNEEGRITFASWRSQKMLQGAWGFRHKSFTEALVGRSIYQLSPPECHSKISCAISETMREIRSGDARIEPPDPARSQSGSSSSSSSGAPQGHADAPHHSRSSVVQPHHHHHHHHHNPPSSDSSDDASDGSFGSDGGGQMVAASGSRPISGNPLAYHHSSGGLNSERLGAQRAPSSSDEDAATPSALVSKDRMEKKNQVCLLRMDGTRMWCMMRATGFLRPPVSCEDPDADGGMSDDEETTSNGGGSQPEPLAMMGLAPAGSAQPEIILSFRPVDGAEARAFAPMAKQGARQGQGQARQPSSSSSSSQPRLIVLPQLQQPRLPAPQQQPQAVPPPAPEVKLLAEEGWAPISSGPAPKKRAVSSGPNGSVPQAAAILTPASAASWPPAPTVATSVQPDPTAEGEGPRGSKRRLAQGAAVNGSTGNASGGNGNANGGLPYILPASIHGVPQPHHNAFYHRHTLLPRSPHLAPASSQPSSQQQQQDQPVQLQQQQHQQSSMSQSMHESKHRKPHYPGPVPAIIPSPQPAPALEQQPSVPEVPAPAPAVPAGGPPEANGSNSNGQDQNHRAIELEAARSLVRIMNFPSRASSGGSDGGSSSNGVIREV